MKEAILYDKIDGGRVRCMLCSHRCVLADGQRGLCNVRVNHGGTLYTTVYGRVVSRSVDPIEKKPLFHFLPGTSAYSIATVGCNFTCSFCQNYMISQYPREEDGRVLGEYASPEEIIGAAKESGCETIAYTYTEPTIFFEYALDTARLAREEELRNVFVSNGYMTPEAADTIIPYLDAINIDLKGISDDFYHDVVGGNVRPVLNSIEHFVRAGVWVEVTTLIIPGLNDTKEQLRWIAEAIRGISPAIPWHVSRFFPAYRMAEVPPTSREKLAEAVRIGREVGLLHVYMGNTPGHGEDTCCPQCGEVVIRRRGYLVRDNLLQDGVCPSCGTKIDGRWFGTEE